MDRHLWVDILGMFLVGCMLLSSGGYYLWLAWNAGALTEGAVVAYIVGFSMTAVGIVSLGAMVTLSRVCPFCGKRISSDSKLCPKCNRELEPSKSVLPSTD